MNEIPFHPNDRKTGAYWGPRLGQAATRTHGRAKPECRIVKDQNPLPPRRLEQAILLKFACNALLPHVEVELQQENRIIFGQGSALLVRFCIHVVTGWTGKGLNLSPLPTANVWRGSRNQQLFSD